MSWMEDANAASRDMRRLAGPYARAILVATPQGNFAVPVDDVFVGLELRNSGSFAANELILLRSLCNSSTRLLAVGAHIGALAIPLAKSCHSVTAIEANPQTFELLNLNVALNGLTNFRAINKAAGNRWEQIEFVMNRVNSGGSKRKPAVPRPDFFYDNPQIMKIESAPLDELLPGETFDVVLMDIEGSEYFALQGMQQILASAAVLQVEFAPHHLQFVANVSVADFLATITPHFHSMVIPSNGTILARDQFIPALSAMFNRGESDSGLLFFKLPPDQVHWRSSPA